MTPPFLVQGDKVAIIATAKKLGPGQIDGAMALVRSWGLEVVEGPHLYTSFNQWAGTDAERLADLQWALDDPEIKAVLFARGGYGTVRIIDKVDWVKFREKPKWLCGFSDLTVIHSHVFSQLGIETLHSSMPVFFQDGAENAGSDTLCKALFGEDKGISFKPDHLNRHGEAAGELVGGNLSVLYSISGSVSEIDFSGKILFLEDLTEYLYHLDRVMWHFKRKGAFKNLAGLVVGQFSDMCDNPVPFGKSPVEIILEAVAEYGYPVAFNAPVGHVPENHALYHGRLCNLKCNDNGSTLDFKME